MKLQGYNLIRDDIADCYCDIEETFDGEYCKAEDVEKLEQEFEAYKKLNKPCDNCHDDCCEICEIKKENERLKTMLGALASQDIEEYEKLQQLNNEMLIRLKEVKKFYGDSIILDDIIEKAEAI